MKLALSMLCENPEQRTGLTTFFHGFVEAALHVAPDVSWVVFAGPQQPWTIADGRVSVVRRLPANNRRLARLAADHLRVGPAARALGADALLTIGFVPLVTAGLPTVMHVFTLHHRGGHGARAVYRRWAVARGLRRAALVVANSEWTASQLRPARRVGGAGAPVIVSPEGVDHRVFRPDGAAGLEDVPPGYLLWAGNFYPYKRADLALAAYATWPAERRARVPFVLAGGDWHGGRAAAEADARRLGIAANVRFLGWVPDEQLPALYRGARALVLSSAEETFGRSVLEAMACGCPCVVQDLPVLREVTGGAARSVDFANTAAAGAVLNAVCSDDPAAAALHDAGLRRAAEFSFERLAGERLAAIREVLAAGGRRLAS